MQTQITSWLRALESDRELNILTSCVHERYDSNLAKTGHNFYAIRTQHNKDWKTEYADLPDNWYVLDKNRLERQIFGHLEFDIVISGDKFSNFQTLAPIAQIWGLPLISIEHTLPPPNSEPWTIERSKMRGVKNVFITEYQIDKWGFNNDPSVCVIRHAIDTELFKPTIPFKERKNAVLEVANDFINRDWCLNFQQYMRVTQGLPCVRVGNTPGFSEAAKDLKDLANHYATCRVFINTHHISPIPMSLLEAAASGCGIVTCNACAISKEFFTHGVNALIANNDQEMRQYLELLLNNEELAEKLGNNARKMILEKCGIDRFVKQWQDIFDEVKLK